MNILKMVALFYSIAAPSPAIMHNQGTFIINTDAFVLGLST